MRSAAATWEEALAQAYARLEAELLARAIGGEPIAHASGEGLAGDEGEAPPFNERLAVTLLTRHDNRSAGRHQGRAAATRPASLAEVEVALRRKLDALAERIGKRP
jgi:hypothetical protein